jgi:hypothetical protein
MGSRMEAAMSSEWAVGALFFFLGQWWGFVLRDY